MLILTPYAKRRRYHDTSLVEWTNDKLRRLAELLAVTSNSIEYVAGELSKEWKTRVTPDVLKYQLRKFREGRRGLVAAYLGE